MKRAKIFFNFLFSVVCLLGVVGLCACRKTAVKLDGDYAVITVAEDAESATLLSYMQTLMKNGEISFTLEDGMVTAINGKVNDFDYNPCWMLYTSDVENANDAWGIVEYDGKQYGSAVVGAESLLIKPGETYIWWYQTF